MDQGIEVASTGLLDIMFFINWIPRHDRRVTSSQITRLHELKSPSSSGDLTGRDRQDTPSYNTYQGNTVECNPYDDKRDRAKGFGALSTGFLDAIAG